MQSLFNGILIAALLAVGIRHLMAASRGEFAFTAPIRAHLGVLQGRSAPAVDRVRLPVPTSTTSLAYSTCGFATGVSYTDQNAQFFAYDVLTVLSGLAAALLVGAAFTRMVWPFALTIGVWILAC